jgi:hypothetical protein
MNTAVFKAFIYDLATTAATIAAAWLTIPDNVSKVGVGDALVPIVVGLAGAGVLALRRYRIESSSTKW